MTASVSSNKLGLSAGRKAVTIDFTSMPLPLDFSATLIAPVGFLRPHIMACLYPMLVPDVC
nr:MAG TPA: hypothetical protein [Caudoviricetes sp.]